MSLTNKTLSQFVKATQNDKKEKTEKFFYGNICVDETRSDKYYVKLEGSNKMTPVSSFTTSIDTGQRVIVMIKNHEAIVTGNVGSPAASTVYVDNKLIQTNGSIDIADINALWTDYFKS